MRRMPITILSVVFVLVDWGTIIAAPPRIVITGEATATGENLIRNASFELGQGEWPDAWQWTSNQPTRVTRFWAQQAIIGERSAGVRSELSAGSGYWLQMVPIKPNQQYILRARVQIEGGKILIRALGHDEQGVVKSFDKRAYDYKRNGHPLVPDFWHPEWVVGMTRKPWGAVAVYFDMSCEPAPTKVQVHVGSYFSEGVSYFDDVYLGPGKLKLTYIAYGSSLQQVRLLDAMGSEIASSGALGEVTNKFENTIQDLPLIGPYCVEVETKDGEVVREWYPKAPASGATR